MSSHTHATRASFPVRGGDSYSRVIEWWSLLSTALGHQHGFKRPTMDICRRAGLSSLVTGEQAPPLMEELLLSLLGDQATVAQAQES